MLEIKLDERLMTAASLVRDGRSVADIGSDHALLPCFLWQKGVADIIASDINPEPLNSARATMKRYGVPEGAVKLVLSDGFGSLPPCDDVIIAGMGGETIVEILQGCKRKNANTRFILQPMTKHEQLRRGLYAEGFKIICEKFAAVSGKPYTIIHALFTGEKQHIDDTFAFIGKQENLFYIKHQLEKLKKLVRGNPHYNTVITNIERKIS